MNVYIRCDIGGHSGWGHAVRMHALALVLRQKGADVTFITTTPALVSFVTPFSTHVMPDEILADTIDSLTRWQFHKVLVIDHKYAYHPSRLRDIRHHMPVVRIDDPTMKPSLCDLLVGPCQHWHPQQVETLHAAFGARFLYGWDYVMLAPEIIDMPPRPYLDRATTEGIMFCAGGSNPTGALDMMWEWAQGLDLDVPLYFPPHGNAKAYRNGLRDAALVVGMFGVSTYECLWYKTPMLVFGHTQENVEGAQALQWASGHQICAGGYLPQGLEYPPLDMIELIYRSTVQRVTEMPSLIDGLGVNRVADAILAL